MSHWWGDSTSQKFLVFDDGNVVELECLPPNVAQCTLGVRLAPDGNNANGTEFVYLVIALLFE